MNIVDPNRLALHREMLDLDILQIVLVEELSPQRATLEYAERELNHRLIVIGGWPQQWWSALPVRLKSFKDEYELINYVDKEERARKAKRVAQFVVSNTVVARIPSDAAMAAMCRLIDPEVDLFYSEDQFKQLYGPRDVAAIVQCHPFRMPPSELDSSPLLYETDEQYADRLFFIEAHYRTMIRAYNSLGIHV